MNKAKTVLFMLMAMMMMMLGCTINRVTERENTITVVGEADIDVFPEKQILEFVVTTAGWSARQLTSDSDVISDRFINAIKELGVRASDVTKSTCEITNPGNSYECKRSIKVVVNDVALVPAIVDCKTVSIRLRSNYYTYPEDITSDIRKVRTLAVQNAQDAAGVLCGASGTRIGKVTKIGGEKITREETANAKQKLRCLIEITYDLVQ